MTSARSDTHPGALPRTHGPPRRNCERCEGLGRTSASGPRCPRCRGAGLEPLRRVVGEAETPAQTALLDQLHDLADERDRLDSDFDIAELNTGPIRDAIVAAREAGIAVRHIAESLRISRQRVHQIENGLRKGERRWS